MRSSFLLDEVVLKYNNSPHCGPYFYTLPPNYLKLLPLGQTVRSAHVRLRLKGTKLSNFKCSSPVKRNTADLRIKHIALFQSLEHT